MSARTLLGILPLVLTACAFIPGMGPSRSSAIYRWPAPGGTSDAATALVELDDVNWVRIDDQTIRHSDYGAVRLPAGTYCLEMGTTFVVSVLVDPRMFVPHTERRRARLEAGGRYELKADRTHGYGYRMWIDVVDAGSGEILGGWNKPSDLHVVGSIAPGDTILGSLDASDSTGYDCSLYEAYRLDVEGATRVRVTLRSSEFDPYLALVSPSGEFIASPDAGRGMKWIRVYHTLEESGTWVVVANAMTPNETGRYRLLVERR